MAGMLFRSFSALRPVVPFMVAIVALSGCLGPFQPGAADREQEADVAAPTVGPEGASRWNGGPRAKSDALGDDGRADATGEQSSWPGEKTALRENLAAGSASVRRPAVIAIYDPYIWADHPAFRVSSAEYAALWDASGAPDAAVSYSLAAWKAPPHQIPARTLIGINDSRVFSAFDANLGDESRFYEGANPHGTQMAGAILDPSVGSCPDCLVVQVFERHAWAWIAQQNWIDAVAIAMGSLTSPTEGISVMVQAVVDSGKPVFVAAGNSPYDVAVRTPQDVVTADTILVDLTREGWAADEHPPVPDFLSEGVFSLPGHDNQWQEASGSSFATPRLAGLYGSFLMEAWEEGLIERDARSDGSVHNRVTTRHPADYLADGVLHSRDVPLMLASVAVRAYETTPTTNSANQLVQTVDPSLRVGYGQVQEPQVEALLRQLREGGLDSAPSPGTMHALSMQARALTRDAAIAMHDHLCPVMPVSFWPIGSCAGPYLESSDWYRP